jgi:exodeoxyribonuclease VII large subunit
VEAQSLSSFNQLVRQTLEQSLHELYWVVAEINEINVNNGHCFMELIEKDAASERIIAKARATVWAYQFRMVQPCFVSITGRELSAGLKVMLQVSAVFHELYGFSLQVMDINPSYTVGELALQKQQVLQQLENEGVLDMNRELESVEVPQRIAVVSSPSAAGYGDFTQQLLNNSAGYAFRQTLFPAVMQGNEADSSVTAALEKIFEREDEFDVVVVIRGGGSQSDLHCFNSYRIAASIAQFPLPVLTGIGHDRDETIADRVANMALKTPTAVAEYLIHQAKSFDDYLQDLSQRLVEAVTEAMQQPIGHIREQSQRLQRIMQTSVHRQDKKLMMYRFRLNDMVREVIAQHQSKRVNMAISIQSVVKHTLTERKNKFPELERRIHNSVRAKLKTEEAKATWLSDKLHLLNPERLLERGYSITLSNGKIVRSISGLTAGQKLETRLSDGTVESVVNCYKLL